MILKCDNEPGAKAQQDSSHRISARRGSSTARSTCVRPPRQRTGRGASSRSEETVSNSRKRNRNTGSSENPRRSQVKSWSRWQDGRSTKHRAQIAKTSCTSCTIRREGVVPQSSRRRRQHMCVKKDSGSVCWIPRPHRLSLVHNGEGSDERPRNRKRGRSSVVLHSCWLLLRCVCRRS